MSPPLVREACEGDVPGLLGLWRELMELHAGIDTWYSMSPEAESVYEKRLREQLADPDSMVLVAESGDGLLGYMAGWIGRRPPVYADEPVGSIGVASVTSSARRRGVGTGLYAAMREWFASRDAVLVELGAAVRNDGARRFWESVGFRAHAVKMHSPLGRTEG